MQNGNGNQDFINLDMLTSTQIDTETITDVSINGVPDSILNEIVNDNPEFEDLININDVSVNNLNSEKDTNKNKKRKKKQAEIDQELVMKFVNEPTHENFNKLWERFYYGVKSYAYKFMRTVEMADEIACITFTRGWEYRHMYNPEKSNFSTWLYTICRNLCLAELYKIKKDNYFPQDISDIYDSEKLSNNIITTSNNNQYTVNNGVVETSTPDDIIKEIYNTSVMEINNLGGNYTTVLRMKLIDDKKIREISDELDMNESTVKNYLYKGKEMLNNIMKKKHKSLYEMYVDCTASIDQEAI